VNPRRFATAALAAATLTSVLAACGGSSGSSGSGGNVTLTYWASNQGTSLDNDKQILQPELDRFKAQTGIAVKLEVITDPPGATLMKNGFQVCDATPCEVTATVNETLELSGEKGPLKGKAKVLAQKDQKVTIKLAAPVAAPPKQRMCEVEIDGLKILRPCP